MTEGGGEEERNCGEGLGEKGPNAPNVEDVLLSRHVRRSQERCEARRNVDRRDIF
jgi:hypothetical protein